MAEQMEMLKKVYDAGDVQNLLRLGRTTTYEFLEEAYRKQEPFRVIKIGKMYRIPRESFESWLDGA